MINKFRAWSNQHKCYYTGGGFFAMTQKGHIFTLEGEGYIFEHFTDLKDINGKEIFEGDIVRYKYLNGFDCDDDDYKTSKNIDFSVEVVKFKDGEFVPREWARLCDDDYYSYRQFDFEVIGNIHENPELLKESEEE